MSDSTARPSGPILEVPAAPPGPPPGFELDVYEHTWTVERDRATVWAWLCDTHTFTDSQIPPWRVEFEDDADGPGDFRSGVYNQHVGPFMAFAGVLGEHRDREYRDLQYFYGSYAVSHALFRPTRLQFWLADGGRPGSTELTLQVDAYVRRRALGLWRRSMGLFWKRFGRWCEKATG
ncbi:MAG: hypothetical protein AAGD33_08460 [Actinomycetota bacterium]